MMSYELDNVEGVFVREFGVSESGHIVWGDRKVLKSGIDGSPILVDMKEGVEFVVKKPEKRTKLKLKNDNPDIMVFRPDIPKEIELINTYLDNDRYIYCPKCRTTQTRGNYIISPIFVKGEWYQIGQCFCDKCSKILYFINGRWYGEVYES